MPPVDHEYAEVGEEAVITNPTLISSALAQLNSSEIDRQIATARAFPRVLSEVRKEIMQLVSQDEEVAASCIYALPRGKQQNASTGKWEQKIVQGPTARFAEIVAYGWGNCRYGARIIEEGEEFVVAQGAFFDLQKNLYVSVEIKRRIVDREGRRYNSDMVGVTSNAALSVASRNAILKAIPRAAWKGLYNAAERVLRGDIKTLVERRAAIVDQFKVFNMTSAAVCRVLGVGGLSDITLDHLTILQGTLTALRDGDLSIEQLLAEAGGQDQSVAAKAGKVVEGIKAKYQPEETKQAAAVRQAQEKLDRKRKQMNVREPAPIAVAIEQQPAVENPDSEPEKAKAPNLEW
jgi:hypothetical protein